LSVTNLRISFNSIKVAKKVIVTLIIDFFSVSKRGRFGSLGSLTELKKMSAVWRRLKRLQCK
jgi:hypothetical protein